MIKEHELKIMPQYFEAVKEGRKWFELRKNDRDFRYGDILILKEWNGERYTGKEIRRRIIGVLKDVPEYGLKDGYCILSMEPVGQMNGETMIGQIIEEVKNEICDKYCKWPDIWDEEKEGCELSESDVCNYKCPLHKL